MVLPSCRCLLSWPWVLHLGQVVPKYRHPDTPPGPISNTAFWGSLPPSLSQVKPSSCHFALGIYHLCFVSWFTCFIPLISLSPHSWVVVSCLLMAPVAPSHGSAYPLALLWWIFKWRQLSSTTLSCRRPTAGDSLPSTLQYLSQTCLIVPLSCLQAFLPLSVVKGYVYRK